MISSIKLRVFLYLASFTILLSILFFAVMILIAYIIEDEIIDKLLNIESQYLSAQYQTTQKIAQPRNNYMQVYHNQRSLPQEVKNVLKKSPQAREIFTSSANHYHLTYIQLGELGNSTLIKNIILLANVTPLLVVTNMSANLFLLFCGVFISALFIATYFSYLISHHTVKPITDLTTRLKNHTLKSSEQNIELPYYQDEIGYLSQTLEDNLNQLQQSLNREKHFTRDVSHELRTPLSVIKNTLALISQRTITQQDIEHITQASREIEHTIDVLFIFARAESLPLKPCFLNGIIEQALLNHHKKIEDKKTQVNMQLNTSITLEANHHLLHLLIDNLIVNAIEHGKDNLLTITYDNHQLIFSNSLLGEKIEIPVDRLLASGVKGINSQGLGHGLFLVSRIAKVMHWTLTATQESSKFTIAISMK